VNSVLHARHVVLLPTLLFSQRLLVTAYRHLLEQYFFGPRGLNSSMHPGASQFCMLMLAIHFALRECWGEQYFRLLPFFAWKTSTHPGIRHVSDTIAGLALAQADRHAVRQNRLPPRRSS